MKIRVLEIIDGLGAGGKERQLLELLRLINYDQFDVGVVTFSIPNQHYDDEVPPLVTYFKELNLGRKLKLFGEIRRCLVEFKPDIIHTWDSFSSFYALHSSCSKGRYLIDGSIRDAGIERGWEYHFKRYLLKRAALVISNSRAGLKYYRMNGEVVYNAIDRSRFRLPVHTDQFNIIMCASFTAYKDHDTFLRSAKILLADGVVDNVYLAGDGPSMKKYVRRVAVNFAELAPQVHFLGRIRDVENWLGRCRIGVLCSTHRYSEGISNSILEYMAAGLVPIATRTGAVTEIISDNVNGILVNPGDWQGIVREVKNLKNDFRKIERLAQNAQDTIASKFNASASVGRLMELYHTILDN